MKSRVLLAAVFFGICLGLGYAPLNRYDPRTAIGLADTRNYIEMVEGKPASTPKRELRILVPALARPIYRVATGRVGSWNPAVFALLIVNSALVAWAALLILSIGELATGDSHVALIGSLLYLLTFNVANLQLAGLVDSVEVWTLLAVTWALLQKRWSLIPIVGAVGAVGKETSVPLVFAFAVVWVLWLWRKKEGQRAPRWMLATLACAQVVAVIAAHAWVHGQGVSLWESIRGGWRFAEPQASRNLMTREILYSFGWLVPFGLARIRTLPPPWIASAATSLLVAVVLSGWYGVAGNVIRPAFDVVGPILCLSAAIFLGEFLPQQRRASRADSIKT